MASQGVLLIVGVVLSYAAGAGYIVHVPKLANVATALVILVGTVLMSFTTATACLRDDHWAPPIRRRVSGRASPNAGSEDAPSGTWWRGRWSWAGVAEAEVQVGEL